MIILRWTLTIVFYITTNSLLFFETFKNQYIFYLTNKMPNTSYIIIKT